MAEINEILSKEAIESIKQLDKLLTDADMTILKLVDHGKQLDASLKGIGSVKELNNATKQLNQNISNLNTVTQKRTAADREAERELKRLNNIGEKWAKSIEDQNKALTTHVNTVRKAEQQNKALRNIIKDIDFETKEGKKQIEAYNRTIERNTKLINDNADSDKKRLSGIGKYKQALTDFSKNIVGYFAVGSLVAGFKEAFKAASTLNRPMLIPFLISNRSIQNSSKWRQSNALPSRGSRSQRLCKVFRTNSVSLTMPSSINFYSIH